MVVALAVARGVVVILGFAVIEGKIFGMDTTAVSVDEIEAESAVKAMTVGRYSGG